MVHFNKTWRHRIMLRRLPFWHHCRFDLWKNKNVSGNGRKNYSVMSNQWGKYYNLIIIFKCEVIWIQSDSCLIFWVLLSYCALHLYLFVLLAWFNLMCIILLSHPALYHLCAADLTVFVSQGSNSALLLPYFCNSVIIMWVFMEHFHLKYRISNSSRAGLVLR